MTKNEIQELIKQHQSLFKEEDTVTSDTTATDTSSSDTGSLFGSDTSSSTTSTSSTTDTDSSYTDDDVLFSNSDTGGDNTQFGGLGGGVAGPSGGFGSDTDKEPTSDVTVEAPKYKIVGIIEPEVDDTGKEVSPLHLKIENLDTKKVEVVQLKDIDF